MTNSLYQPLDWTEGLPGELIDVITSKMHGKTLQADEVLYHQGQHLPFLYKVHSGSLDLCNFTPEGQRFVAGILRAGDWGGELSVVMGVPAVYTAAAREPLQLSILPRNEFKALQKSHPEINEMLLEKFARYLRVFMDRATMASTGSVRDRIVWLLSWLADSQGVFLDDNCCRLDGVKLGDLYPMLGAARQSVSKEFNKLIEEGIIAHERKVITVLDYNLLVELSRRHID